MKKGKTILLVFFIVIILLLVFIVFFKYIKQNIDNNEIPYPTLEQNKKYKALEELEEIDFDLQNMIENKYYIEISEDITCSKVVYHKDELDKFIENANKNIPDEIRIVQFEYKDNNQQLAVKNIEFTGNEYIVKIDNRWNEYLSERNKKIVTHIYDARNYKVINDTTSNEIIYSKTYSKINLVSNNGRETVYLCDYLISKTDQDTKFELEFIKDLTKGKETILLSSETNKYDYDIFSYNGTINISINGVKTTLREALLTNKITIEEILEKANKDVDEYKTITKFMFADGGTQIYFYDNYAIVKFNRETIKPDTISINKDLYIGNPAINLDEIK